MRDALTEELDAVRISFDGAGIFGASTEAETQCGCTEVEALNYTASASYDDGSCLMSVGGCTSAEGCNYNPFATDDDNSCIFTQDDECNCSGDVPDALECVVAIAWPTLMAMAFVTFQTIALVSSMNVGFAMDKDSYRTM